MSTGTSAWQDFWNRGGLAKAVLLVAAYWVLYIGAGRLIGALFSGAIDEDDLMGSGTSVLVAVAGPILVGSVLLVWFARSVGWWGRMFAPQPLRGARWMWIAPILVVVVNLLRLVSVDFASYTVRVLLAMVVFGLAVGFAEELLCRGLVVDLLRRAGHKELSVALLSSLLFALLHVGNIFSGMSAFTVAITVVFTFGFGVAMYLTLRVTGNLLWPVLLHALTDPATFLFTGGIDEQTTEASGGVARLAELGNIVIVITGVALVWFVRGRVSAGRRDETDTVQA